MRALFISDTHIKKINERNSQTLLRFLRGLKEDPPTHLVFLGDIFDLWVADHQYFILKFSPIINEVMDLIRKKVKVFYFEGNHDFHLKKYWQDIVGVEVYEGPQVFDLEGLKIRAEHGDLINTEDQAYQRYYKFSRHPYTKWGLYNMPTTLVKFVGETFSQVSRKYSEPLRAEQQSQLRQMIRKHAEAWVAKDQFDYIITGHMHTEDEHEFQYLNKKRISINLGSWESTQKVLQVKKDGYAWIDLNA